MEGEEVQVEGGEAAVRGRAISPMIFFFSMKTTRS